MSTSKLASTYTPSSASLGEINNIYDTLHLMVEKVKCREKEKYALLRRKLEAHKGLQLELDERLKSFLCICDMYILKIKSDHAYQVKNKRLLTGKVENAHELTM